MASVNTVILVGNLGKDAELRMAGGNSLATFSVATTENWKTAAGEKRESTEWHRVVLWGNIAEKLQPLLTKGKQVYVTGKLQTRSWDKDGQKHYSTEIKADRVVLLGGGRQQAEDDAYGAGTLPPMPPPKGQEDIDDLIPF
jgi:single-strand DNA-binding protein